MEMHGTWATSCSFPGPEKSDHVQKWNVGQRVFFWPTAGNECQKQLHRSFVINTADNFYFAGAVSEG